MKILYSFLLLTILSSIFVYAEEFDPTQFEDEPVIIITEEFDEDFNGDNQEFDPSQVEEEFDPTQFEDEPVDLGGITNELDPTQLEDLEPGVELSEEEIEQYSVPIESVNNENLQEENTIDPVIIENDDEKNKVSISREANYIALGIGFVIILSICILLLYTIHYYRTGKHLKK